MKNDKKEKSGISRRQFIGSSLSLATGLVVGTGSACGAPAFIKKLSTPNSKIKGVQIGVITYSYRSMEDQSAKAILKAIVNSGISGIELMGDPAEVYAGRPENPVDRMAFYMLMRKSRDSELTSDEQKQMDEMQAQIEEFNQKVADWRASVSMDKFAELRKMYNDAGVDIYAWKPSAFGENNSDDEISYAFRAAKALGASACTTEHPGNDQQTKRLGDLAERHQVYMSYHAHTQATPTLWDTALEQSDYNAINLDIGHWVAGGNPSVVDFIREKHNRIESLHLKDRQTPADGAGNLMWGRGDTPIREVLQLMRDNNYNFPASVELEYQIPDGSNAVKEVKRCLDYCRNSLTV